MQRLTALLRRLRAAALAGRAAPQAPGTRSAPPPPAPTSGSALWSVVVPTPADVRPSRRVLDLSGAEQFEIGRIVEQGGLGGYEPEVFALLAAYVETAAAPVRFLDVGANIGLFSLALPAVFGPRVEVAAFEPMPSLAGFIEDAARRNGTAIDVRRVAVGREAGRAPLYVSSRTDCSNSLRRRFRPFKQVLDVEVATLDALYGATEGPFLVKIDTESTEPDVLAGALAFVRRVRPPIVCEVLAGRTEAQLLAWLEEVGYVAIHVTDAPAWEGTRTLAGDSTYAFRDWLFVPEPPGAELRARFAAWHAALVGSRARPAPPA